MTYFFLTYEAIELLASDRPLQTSDNKVSDVLCDILRQKRTSWEHPRINITNTTNGLVFFTRDSSSKKGILIDLATFSGFSEAQDNRAIINIFQKIVKYGVRHFDGLPLASCEKEFPDSNVSIIFPNPFVPNSCVPKIVIDRKNEKLCKKGYNYLVVAHYCCEEKLPDSTSTINKAYEELRLINYKELVRDDATSSINTIGFSSVSLDQTDLSIDARVGYDNWIKYHLTDTQRDFVLSEVDGPERLDGAAGTGKTLCLILKCIHLLKIHVENNSEYHLIFFTHSLSTKDKIISVFQSNWDDFEFCREEGEFSRPKQSIKITTLQEWSADHLGTNSISDNEFLDKDATNSKTLQIYYIEEAYRKVIAELWDNVYNLLCSEKFKSFIKNTSDEDILELIRQEIAVMIKGRASCDFEKYRSIERPKYSLPLFDDMDYKFVFNIYRKYQESLEKVGQYDSDDITITALGQVDTPIWNRRRNKEGYDACFIDETHLFNINELSVFHFVNKQSGDHDSLGSQKIVFAIDRSQSTGDWGIDDISIRTALRYSKEESRDRFNTVFRCSQDITALALGILASGATLFTFENPLTNTGSDFNKEDMKKTLQPEYLLVQNDGAAVVDSIVWAENYCRQYGTSKNRVLLIGTTDFQVELICKYLYEHNKPYEKLASRSDSIAMRKALDGNKFVVSQIDYVGGLEFDATLILGVDDGRVPPSKNEKSESYHVVRYAWHTRMYVAVTRAKYAVRLYGEQSRGISPLLSSSLTNKVLKKTELN